MSNATTPCKNCGHKDHFVRDTKLKNREYCPCCKTGRYRAPRVKKPREVR